MVVYRTVGKIEVLWLFMKVFSVGKGWNSRTQFSHSKFEDMVSFGSNSKQFAKVFPAKIVQYFPLICKSFLPQKFSTIQYS